MIFTRELRIDIAQIGVNETIHLHEGDVNGTEFYISLYKNGEPLSLALYNVKYDASIDGYLAEQDADVSLIQGNEIHVPITERMTAKNGILRIDIKLMKNYDIAFIQTVEAFVQRRVINDEVVIDVSGTTIGAKLQELDTKIVQALESLDDKADISDIPTKVSDLDNDAHYADVSDIPTKVSDLENDAHYLTSHQDISGKEDKSNKRQTINPAEAQNNSTIYPSVKAVIDYVANNHQDISGKVDKTRKIAGVDLQDDITASELKTALSVPTKTSDLTNDSGFLTQHQDISGKMDLAFLHSGGSTEDIELGQLFLTRRGLNDYNLNIQLSQSGESGRQIAWAGDIPDVSGKQDKQTSLPEVATVEYHGEWIPDTSDIVFQNLSIGQLFQCDILEVVHIYQKTSASTYFDLHGVLHTEDLPTNVSAFINDAGYLTAQGITGKMDLAQIRASIDDDTQVKQGQFLVVGGNVWLKTRAYGAAGHLVLEDQANRVSTIASTADNSHYPTVLAVKDYVDTVIGGIESGSY